MNCNQRLTTARNHDSLNISAPNLIRGATGSGVADSPRGFFANLKDIVRHELDEGWHNVGVNHGLQHDKSKAIRSVEAERSAASALSTRESDLDLTCRSSHNVGQRPACFAADSILKREKMMGQKHRWWSATFILPDGLDQGKELCIQHSATCLLRLTFGEDRQVSKLGNACAFSTTCV